MVFSFLRLGEGRLEGQKVKDAVRTFSELIERNKDRQPYSDYKEGINQGLEIAKDAFEENVENFVYFSSNEDRAAQIKSLQDRYDLLLDAIIVEKPRHTRSQLEGIDRGFEKSKELFEDFIKDFI